MTARSRTLVVGQGMIGAAVSRRLWSDGHLVTGVSRTACVVPWPHAAADLSTRTGRDDLVTAIGRIRADTVVLVHGPSDVTWCEAHADQAFETHCGVAAAVAGLGTPVVMVSTDNVFDGSRGRGQVTDPVSPWNAYGRAKLAAEQALLTEPGNTVVRVSLVYGWSGGAHRSNFGEMCLRAAANRSSFEAPQDQYFTPVHISTVATAIAAVATAPKRDTVPSLIHLAGPDLLSRAEFARVAYRVVGAPPELVHQVPRAETAWASRPPVSALQSCDLSGIPGLEQFAGWPVESGLRQMWRERP